MSDAKAILEILNQPELSDWQRSARIIGKAFEWCHDSLNNVRGDRVNTLQGLSELVRALTLGVTVLNQITPMVEASRPGPTLRETLGQVEQDIAKNASDIEQLTQDVARLEKAENRYQLLTSEKERLETRYQHLNRIRQFDEHGLEELRDQVSKLEETTQWVEDIENLEGEINKSGSDLIALSQKTLQLLQGETRNQLDNAQALLNDITTELDQQKKLLSIETNKYHNAQQELSAAIERYKGINQELVKVSDTLAEYVKADRFIANALTQPASISARESLDQIEMMLKNVDEMLRQALIANDAAQKIIRLPL